MNQVDLPSDEPVATDPDPDSDDEQYPAHGLDPEADHEESEAVVPPDLVDG